MVGVGREECLSQMFISGIIFIYVLGVLMYILPVGKFYRCGVHLPHILLTECFSSTLFSRYMNFCDLTVHLVSVRKTGWNLIGLCALIVRRS